MTYTRVQFDFSDRNVLVVGGSKGIGKGVVEGFLAAGANTFYASRKPMLDSCTAHHIATDLRDETQISALFKKIDRHGPVNVLVNAAAIADVMNSVVSCSRPIVDAKWLEKSRQVGTSGQTVKPKVYMAMGISGSFQHMGGVKGKPFIVAVNKNPKAPIFQVADVGIVEDILDFMPELTEAVNDL